MIRLSQIKCRPGDPESGLLRKAAAKLRINESEIAVLNIVRKSVDARKKDQISVIYQVDVVLKNPSKEKQLVKKMREAEARLLEKTEYMFPQCNVPEDGPRPVIIGSGPAGIFCAYMLASHGFKPLVLERGGDVEERSRAVEAFWNGGTLDPECNVQFGEGGAGTFSDGKLNTLVKDPELRGRKVLEIFTEMGADPDILYEQKPHIGTDVLKTILVNIRHRIEELGGEILFHTKLTELVVENEEICGIKTVDTRTGELNMISCHTVVLAIGHSARDTFQMLKQLQIPMQPKPFAVGLRMEHPQRMIQISQYGEKYADTFPAAPYKVTAKASDGRGVYSFCMCPGGYVVNASSEPGRLAVNGMSYHARDSRNANSAMIVTVGPEDFGSNDILAGMEFQRRLEEKAYEAGKGAIPVQLYGDFKENRVSEAFGEVSPCMKGAYRFGNLRTVLPEMLSTAFIEGIEECGKKIRGFNRADAVLSGIESRTSSPVKILRDEFLESPIKGLYPCGEGAGYAGGITSAAMDGIRVAEMIAKKSLS